MVEDFMKTMENKMTAVEWLKENLPSLFQDDSGHYQKLFEQAKAMEKEQMIEFYVEGCLDTYGCDEPSEDCNHDKKQGEQYYNETYNK
jgi:hypothetical protein